MTLVKTSLLNGLAVAVKIASALLLNKLFAVYVGPAGYAVIGQFQNAISVVVNIVGGMFTTGVTKSTAQHFDDVTKQHAVWQTAIRFSLSASLLAGICLLVTGDWLSVWLLHRTDMSNVFFWLALSLPAMAANNLLIAIINGKKEFGIYVKSNIIGILLSMVVTGALAINFGLNGALIAFTINPAIALLSTSFLILRCPWLEIRYIWGQIDRTALRELSGFGFMGLTSALIVPVTYMIVREHLSTKLGLKAAGYWQSSWKISEIYLMLVTTTLSVYYLPRLAEIRFASELKAEIAKVYRFVLPIIVIGAVAIYLLRDFIINTLFTPDFMPMRELFPWQLAGDVVKIGSWILAYIMLGRAMVKFYVITEILFSVSFVILCWLLVGAFDLVGVSMAYAINYSLYWIAMTYLVRHEMQQMGSQHIQTV